MNENPLKPRLAGVLLFFAAFLLLFLYTLYNAQIVHGNDYRAQAATSYTSTQEVKASRGVITDRNGKVLIGNRLTYTLTLKDGFDDDAQANETILRLLELCRAYGVTWTDTLPLESQPPFGLLPSGDGEVFRDFLKTVRQAQPAGARASGELLPLLRAYFAVPAELSDEDARALAGVRYELAVRPSYLFATDVPVELISQVVDGRFPCVTTGTASARVYNTACAAHLLGRISPIYAETWPAYRDKGYAMDALVGSGGVEEAFEDYLRGIDGTRLITTDENGKITGELYATPPQPGGNVALTLDIDLQRDTEQALQATIDGMIDKDTLQRGGAAAVVKVGTGEILALASYPTYDPATFQEDYEKLLQDERLPMFNRAVDGAYPPGSTFKPYSAVAALESGIITPYTTILDRGIYTYYAFPQPMCWIYSSGGGTHGSVNVTQAITVSCNYFFYEVGRRMGIETLADYATQFGLGQHTGVEIGDSAGALACPAYAEANDLEWTDGQTITAAIGQSYNLFTPLQLANYIATLVSGGQHYAAHLLKDVKSYDNSALQYVWNDPPLNTVDISQTTLDAVLEGMHNLTTYGSVSYQFSRCVVSAGAKTGTAEVGTDISNGVFVAFAPYENPEIAVAVVIEKGGSGAALADTAVAIINSYFSREGSGSAQGENTLIK